MQKLFVFLLVARSLLNTTPAQSYTIIESNANYIKIEFNFENAYSVNESVNDGIKLNSIKGKEINIRKPGDPWLPDYRVNIGVPHNATLKMRILSIIQDRKQDIFIIPTPDSLSQPYSLLNYNQSVYNENEFFPLNSAEIDGDFVMRYSRIVSLSLAPYQFNPVTREVLVNKKIIVQIDFQLNDDAFDNVIRVTDKMTDEILRSSVINYETAQYFVGEQTSPSISPLFADTFWYNPQKDYYKIYLNGKGVYRVTYDMLINSGVPSNNGIQDKNLELFCNGESIPIDVVDLNNDNLFNSGDYFQFVGEHAKPTNHHTRMNIYNRSNVYWFSYQADSLNYFKNVDGFPIGTSPFINSSVAKLRWEKDLNYQRFGHANTDQRDYWQWGSAEAKHRAPHVNFVYWIEDSIWSNFNAEKPQAKIKVGLHGLTNRSCGTQNGHNATIKFNFKPLGSVNWNGTEPAEYQKDFYLSFFTLSGGDTAQLYYDGFQKFEVELNGNICPGDSSDVVLTNYLELEYWRWNRTYPNYYYFSSPPFNFDDNHYYLFNWGRDNMKVYIPSRGEFITNAYITNDEYSSVRFIDTISQQTDYYCVADDYYMIPDSILRDTPSDLRNLSNGADYIIITHPLFKSAAERLAQYRSNNLAGYTSPRVKLVDVFDIYDEFSAGLVNPFALQYFVKYAFENWVRPAPLYIVLIGDASYDYRQIYSSSRQNFVPSLPYHASTFGQLPSDNLIVAVSGTDISPDLALGRLSCETLAEANNLVDKIVNYPADNGKAWKENVLLLSSGLSYDDQISFGFNNASKRLENLYLLPNGINTTKVFNFPEPPDITFYGSGPRMREEINKGAAIVNYYGHGGGAQWDLIFTKDDLYELNNSGRLPLALSITCYTAHFENAEAFGEVFTRIPNKGAIGFWGSVGLTWWSTGQSLNQYLFNQIFNFKNHVIGKAILTAKASVSGGFFDQMIAQLSYLGDPAIELTIPKYPDFQINSSDISIQPINPLVNDTVRVKIGLKNLGVTFGTDSVTVQLYKNILLPENLVGEVKLPSFGSIDSAFINWIPDESKLHTLIVLINEKDTVWEIDHSDNKASASFAVYSFDEPNLVKPINGYFTTENTVRFSIIDIGNLFSKTFSYAIELDTTKVFNSPARIISESLSPQHSIISWTSPALNQGEYYWRALIFDDLDTNQSQPRSFSISADTGIGFLARNKLLKEFTITNINYSTTLNSLVLNTEIKPPHPEPKFLLDSILIALPDSVEPSVFTTDGSYLYYAHLSIWIDGSKIYKIGTGENGTIKGHNYGSVPGISQKFNSHLFHRSGYLYASIDSSNNTLLQIDPQSGDTATIFLSDTLLISPQSPTQIGGYYFYHDGTFVYNLAMGTELLPNKFVLRTFNPANNWSKVGDDLILSGALVPNVTSFIIVNGSLIIYENRFAFYLRRYNLSDGFFEEEWTYSFPSKNYYAIAYDYQNNYVYFNSFKPVGAYPPGFFKYAGTYKEAAGSVVSQEIGPASSWNQLNYDIDNIGSTGVYNATLLGRRTSDKGWDTLATSVPAQMYIDTISVSVYDHLRMRFDMVDSSFGTSEPLKFKSLKVNYTSLPEVVLSPDEYVFSADTLLQGFPIQMQLKIRNVGYSAVDSLLVAVYMNNSDSAYFTRMASVKSDSTLTLNETLITDKLLYTSPVTKIALKVVASNKGQEFYTFNNIVENEFYVSRDSLRPAFSVTFDGQEIVNGDIISAKPEILITLSDNSPLPLTENMFTLIYTENNKVPRQLNSTNDNLEFSTTLHPNSEANYRWTPEFLDGTHKLEILAKDSSGNYFDTTSYRKTFFVFNQADLREVYNFPNPFKDDTYFTFELRGFEAASAQDVQIKVFTVAGRLIKDFTVPASQLQAGFNRVYWDGKDQDGDIIANGLYFYKVIARLNGETKTVTQKLAKIK